MKRKMLAVGLVALGITMGLAGPAAAAVPNNDDFDAATAITTLPHYEVIFAAEATQAVDDPSCASGARTVWWTYTPATDLRVDASTFGSNFDSTLAVYTGTRGALTQIACNDDTLGVKQSSARFDAVAGQTYYIQVSSLATGTRGTLKLNVAEAPGPPENDSLEDATKIASLPYRNTLDTREATKIDEPDCLAGTHTVWYTFDANDEWKLHLNTGYSYFRTVIAVYEVDGDQLRTIGCQLTNSFVFEPERGRRYAFQIGAANGYGEYLDFRLEEIKKPPPPLRVNISVNKVGSVNEVTGVARVQGTVTCSRPATVSISGSLRQSDGSNVTHGDFYRNLKCNGKARRWSDVVSGGNRAFHSGPAGVRVSSGERGKPVARVINLRACDCEWGL